MRKWLDRVGVYLLFYLAAFGRFLSAGMTYFPQLDDYIQFDKYADFAPLGEMIERLGLLASRPLAGVADIVFWSRFWDAGMIAAVALVSALWVGSALLWRRVFDRLFGCGGFFCVLYLLFPLNLEGTYWLSASTRVVCGMFFCALALWCFLRLLAGGSRWYALAFALTQALAFCFYEQTLALSGGAVLGLMALLLLGRDRRKRAWWGLLTFANLAAYFAFTLGNAGGSLAGRMQLILPWHEGYFTSFVPKLGWQFVQAFVGGGLLIPARGTVRGLAVLADGGWWYLALFIAIGVGVGVFCRSSAGEPRREDRLIAKTRAGLVYGALLVLAAVSPFFVVDNSWFSLRNTVPAMAGLALMADLLLQTVMARIPRAPRCVTAIVAGVLTVLFGIVAASEIRDYRLTYRHDQVVLTELAETLDGAEGRIGVLNLNPSVLTEQNYFYHEHIHGVTESYWAIQGALWAMTDAVPDVYPLATDSTPYYLDWNRDLKRIGAFDAIWWWDDATSTLIPLTATGDDAAGWTLTDPTGRVVARVHEDAHGGQLTLP